MASHRSAIRCKFFARGNCRNGEACPFAHDFLDPKAPYQDASTYHFGQDVLGMSPKNSKNSEMFEIPSRFVDQSRYKWVSPLLKERERAKELVNRKNVGEDDRDAAPESPGSAIKSEQVSPISADQSFKNINTETNEEESKSESAVDSSLLQNFQNSCGSPGRNKDSKHYSKTEDLTSEELEQFKADRFELSKVPAVPPPLEFC